MTFTDLAAAAILVAAVGNVVWLLTLPMVALWKRAKEKKR